MRLWGLLFVVFCSLSMAAWADREYPTWFIAKDRPLEVEKSVELSEDVDDEELQQSDVQNEVKQDVVQEKTAVMVENEPKLQDETKPLVMVSDKLRFARNNKDLILAQKWLQKEFREDNSKNIVLSPLSFYSASVLLANGVVDETLFEFSNMFPVLQLAVVNKQMQTYINSKKGSLSVYLSLWGSTFSSHYQTLMQQKLGAEIWGLSDTTAPINEWINVRTEGMITTIAPEKDVSKEDIILASAVCFKNKWQIPFDADRTKDGEFLNLNGQKSPILMMHKKSNVLYYEDDVMQAVRLFYKTGDYITILLPKEGVSFEDFIDELSIQEFMPAFEATEVELFIPKFDYEYEVSNSKEVYKMMGISKIFSGSNYDFAKMVNFDTPEYISDVYFKARITIDEERTEATEVSTATTSKGAAPVVSMETFRANRPFIFMINNGDFIGAITHGNN